MIGLIASDCFLLQNRLVEAEEAIERVLSYLSLDEEMLLQCAAVLKACKKNSRAMETLEFLLRIQPSSRKGVLLYIQLLIDEARIKEAVYFLVKRIRVNGSSAELYNALGLCLYSAKKTGFAELFYKHAMFLDSSYAEPLNNLSNIRRERGCYQEAIRLLEKAVQMDKVYHTAYVNLATLLLQQDEYEAGWTLYEHRLNAPGFSPPVVIPKGTVWDGSLRVNTLLVVAEQGIGDFIQFYRFLKLIDNRVVICVPEHIMELCSLLRPSFEVIAPSRVSSIEYDAWIPLMSLPHRLGLNSPAELKSDQYLERCSLSRIYENTNQENHARHNDVDKVIGLCWQGNPRVEYGEQRDRSIALGVFKEIADHHRRFRFISLQKGVGANQLAGIAFRDQFIESPMQVSEDSSWLHTASLIAQTDVVITVDTSVAHLSGAMGHPTVLLLSETPEWRWGLQKETTHWYESMCIFRKRKGESWEAVIRRVVRRLSEDESRGDV
jgi:Flp pilus assembly protein TadD